MIKTTQKSRSTRNGTPTKKCWIGQTDKQEYIEAGDGSYYLKSAYGGDAGIAKAEAMEKERYRAATKDERRAKRKAKREEERDKEDRSKERGIAAKRIVARKSAARKSAARKSAARRRTRCEESNPTKTYHHEP